MELADKSQGYIPSAAIWPGRISAIRKPGQLCQINSTQTNESKKLKLYVKGLEGYY